MSVIQRQAGTKARFLRSQAGLKWQRKAQWLQRQWVRISDFPNEAPPHAWRLAAGWGQPCPFFPLPISRHVQVRPEAARSGFEFQELQLGGRNSGQVVLIKVPKVGGGIVGRDFV